MNGTLNKVMLIGRLGSDVKLTYFEKDSCVGQVSLATDESYTDKTTQQKVENTQWHNLVFNNKLAELVAKYVRKGDLLYVEGRLRTRQYQSQDGTPRYITEIVASDVNFLTPKKGTSQEATNIPQSVSATPQAEGSASDTGMGAPSQKDVVPF